MSNFESISNLDIDEKFKERLKSVWYFPEYHPIAFLYDLFFFRMSLNWWIDYKLMEENRPTESSKFHKFAYDSESANSFFWGIFGIFGVWGCCTCGVGLLFVRKICDGRLEVLTAIRNANKRSIH